MLFMVTFILLQGCAGKVIHDAERSATATQAKEDYQKIDLFIPIKTERKNQLALLNSELDVVNRLVKAAHDSEIYTFVNSTKFIEKFMLKESIVVVLNSLN